MPVQPPDAHIAWSAASTADGSGAAAPGAALTVTSGPYVAGTTAYVVVESNAILLGEGIVGANGELTVDVTLPVDLPVGSHHLIVYGETSAGFARDARTVIEVATPAPDSTTTEVAAAATVPPPAATRPATSSSPPPPPPLPPPPGGS